MLYRGREGARSGIGEIEAHPLSLEDTEALIEIAHQMAILVISLDLRLARELWGMAFLLNAIREIPRAAPFHPERRALGPARGQSADPVAGWRHPRLRQPAEDHQGGIEHFRISGALELTLEFRLGPDNGIFGSGEGFFEQRLGFGKLSGL
jgi:hypothetical protein